VGSINLGSEAVTPFDISALERQVDELIQVCNRLREENTWLRARQATLADDRAQLVEKTELARSRVESMISRLKSMEDGL
jgi:cell division protein ZapB